MNASDSAWIPVLSSHRTPAEIAALAPLLDAAGVTPDDLAEALADPHRALLWCHTPDPPPWPWFADPIARALACAELAKQAADTQIRFANLRAAAVADAVADSTVAAVSRQIGVRQQVVSRLHARRRHDPVETIANWLKDTFGSSAALIASHSESQDRK